MNTAVAARDDVLTLLCFRREMAAGSGAAGRDLYEFLVDAELQHYYNGLRNDLKVTSNHRRMQLLNHCCDGDLVIQLIH